MSLDGYKTYIGIATFVIGMIASHFKLTIASQDISDVLSLVVELIGTVGAVYGRVKVKPVCPQPLTVSTPLPMDTSGVGKQSNG